MTSTNTWTDSKTSSREWSANTGNPDAASSAPPLALATPRTPPLLVAIVGGSCSGKNWLADQLKARLGRMAARLSLDDFYRDRAHLPPTRRARINYDHPRAIDWADAERVLRELHAGRATRAPRYDFKHHTRSRQDRVLRPKPVLLIDGLWWLRRARLRRLFALTIFIDCSGPLRLRRRLARDVRARGRDLASVRRQFLETVEPMNRRFVSPQARWAHARLRAPINARQVDEIERQLRLRLKPPAPNATRRLRM